VNIRLNGKTREVAAGWTVRDLVAALGFRSRVVVVERNGEPVPRSSFASTPLGDGDVVEIVRPVPGG